jgi:zinc transport system substrate-binding protein
MAAFGEFCRNVGGCMGRAGAVLSAPAALAILLSSAMPAQADSPTVVVSIKPIHSLVASVMEGVGEPVLLVEGGASPHGYTLKPSQAAALSKADLVVWIGEGMETWLATPMETLVPAGNGLELADLSTITLLPGREGGVWEAHAHDEHADEEHDHAEDEHVDEEHDHAEDEHAHEHGGYDPHIWFDPHNAAAMARAVADRLMELDPDNAAAYEANLAALTAEIEALDTAAEAALAPVRDRPFIVFHDAYQYFEHHYGLAGVGSITLDPEQAPSAARLAAIRERLADADVVCAFAEPIMDPGLLETAVEGSDVTLATIDPEGIALEAGPALYGQLLGNLAEAMAACLAARS